MLSAVHYVPRLQYVYTENIVEGETKTCFPAISWKRVHLLVFSCLNLELCLLCIFFYYFDFIYYCSSYWLFVTFTSLFYDL